MTNSRRTPAPHGFTLVEVLVSLAVVVLLIGIMLPSISAVRESGRRIVCASNMRQFGLGLSMYADANRDFLPQSVFLGQRDGDPEYEKMTTLRTLPVAATDRTPARDGWDGLGMLYREGQLRSPGVFYCPSHNGDHPLSRYANAWSNPRGVIVGNYHFRGSGPSEERRLYRIDGTAGLVADGLTSIDNQNHPEGLNVLAANLSVSWIGGLDGVLGSVLPRQAQSAQSDDTYEAWRAIDQQLANGPATRD